MRKILTALLCSIVFVAGVNYQAIADYAATAGSGLTFGSVDLAGIKFPAFLVCDPTTAKQCAGVDASNNLKVTAVGVANGATFGSQSGSPVLCYDTTSPTGGTNGQLGFVNCVAGTGQVRFDSSSWAGTALGAPSNYGTSPGAVAVPGVNAFITNTPTVSLNAVASGGWTPKHIVAANSDNATNLKASAGIVHAVQVFGIGAAPAYLKFYNKATSPTCGSDAVVKSVMIPAASTAANGAGAVAVVLDTQFSTGISYCVVTGLADTDDTSVAASTFIVNIDWL